MQSRFDTWLPFSDSFIHVYVAQLVAAGVSASTINSHIAALGTFAVWAGFPRPRSELVSYIIRGKGKVNAPPPKSRIHSFKLVEAVQGLNNAIIALPESPTRLHLLYLCIAFFALVWPVRPHTLLSCSVADTRISKGAIFFKP